MILGQNYTGINMDNPGSLEERAKSFGKIVKVILSQFLQLHDCAAGGGEANLGHHDLRVIEYLGEEGPQMMRSVAEHLGLAVNSTTSLIDNLENKNFVQRTRSETDRRVVNVELTNEGRRVFEVASSAKHQFHRSLLAALTDDEQQILLVLFRKIAREASAQVENLANESANA